MDPHRWTQEPQPTCKLQLDVNVGSIDIVHGPSSLAVFRLDSSTCKLAGHRCRIRRLSSWTLIVDSVPTGLKSLQTTCKLQLDIDVGSADIVHEPSSLAVFRLDSSTCKLQLDIGVGSADIVHELSLLAVFQLDSRILDRPTSSSWT